MIVLAAVAGFAALPAESQATLTIDPCIVTGDCATITATPPALSPSASATFSYKHASDMYSFACKLDGGAFEPCPDGSPAGYIGANTVESKAYSGLTDGAHTFTVHAVNYSRICTVWNPSPPYDCLAYTYFADTDTADRSYSWTVDATPPTAFFSSAPAAGASLAKPETTIAFGAHDITTVTFRCSLDGAPFAACTSPVSLNSLKPGSHAFVVEPTDQAGNVGADATRAFSSPRRKCGKVKLKRHGKFVRTRSGKIKRKRVCRYVKV